MVEPAKPTGRAYRRPRLLQTAAIHEQRRTRSVCAASPRRRRRSAIRRSWRRKTSCDRRPGAVRLRRFPGLQDLTIAAAGAHGRWGNRLDWGAWVESGSTARSARLARLAQVTSAPSTPRSVRRPDAGESQHRSRRAQLVHLAAVAARSAPRGRGSACTGSRCDAGAACDRLERYVGPSSAESLAGCSQQPVTVSRHRRASGASRRSP